MLRSTSKISWLGELIPDRKRSKRVNVSDGRLFSKNRFSLSDAERVWKDWKLDASAALIFLSAPGSWLSSSPVLPELGLWGWDGILIAVIGHRHLD